LKTAVLSMKQHDRQFLERARTPVGEVPIGKPFESALRVLRSGGTLSSLGAYSGDLVIPADAFSAGLGDNKIVTSLCPGGKERMRRLMEVVQSGRVDLSAMVTHRLCWMRLRTPIRSSLSSAMAF
jgi:threonine dehydrogenase-like Zn-dependent dehydrogenase